MATFQSFFAALADGRAASAGIAAADVPDVASDPHAPDLDDHVEASADRAAVDRAPAVEPVYEPPRPVILDHIPPAPTGGGGRPVAAPIPTATVASSATVTVDTPTQVVPASGGIARRVVLVNSGGVTVYVSPDRRESTTGYALAAGETLTTASRAPMWAWVPTGGGDGDVAAWIDNYAEPA